MFLRIPMVQENGSKTGGYIAKVAYADGWQNLLN